MKLSRRDIKALQLLIIFFILISTAVTMIYPERIGYSYSLKDVKDKQNDLNDSKNQLANNESIIEEKITNLNEAKKKAKEAKQKADLIRMSVGKNKLSMHIPSLLVTLEQNAIKNKVSLKIKYNEIKTHSSNNTEVKKELESKEDIDQSVNTAENKIENNSVKPEIKVQGKPKDNSDIKEGGKIEVKKETKKETQEKPKEDNEKIKTEEEKKNDTGNENLDDEEHHQASPDNQMPSIEGINITSIPLEIEGNYDNVREYLKFLDELDFVEPNSASMASDGDKITGNIIIYVFHGEVY